MVSNFLYSMHTPITNFKNQFVYFLNHAHTIKPYPLVFTVSWFLQVLEKDNKEWYSPLGSLFRKNGATTKKPTDMLRREGEQKLPERMGAGRVEHTEKEEHSFKCVAI